MAGSERASDSRWALVHELGSTGGLASKAVPALGELLEATKTKLEIQVTRMRRVTSPSTSPLVAVEAAPEFAVLCPRPDESEATAIMLVPSWTSVEGPSDETNAIDTLLGILIA